MANILSQQFKSVFTPKDIPDASLKPPQNGKCFSEIIVPDKDIKEPIKDMAIRQDQDEDLVFTKASIYKEYVNQLT